MTLNARLKFLALMCLLLSVLTGSQARSVPFQPGERVAYRLWYNWAFIWISAATADFTVEASTYQGIPSYIFSVAGSTLPSFDSFFCVRDTLRSEVDQEDLYPFWGGKHANEGKWHGNDDFTFERSMVGEGDTARLGWKVRTQLTRHGEIASDVTELTVNDGFDILTSVYRLRSIPEEELVKANPMLIPMRLDDGEYTVYLTYQRDETIKLHKGDVWDCHLFYMTLVEGTVFKKGDYMKIWLSKDGNCVPLQIETPISVGSVKAIFQDASGLRQ